MRAISMCTPMSPAATSAMPSPRHAEASAALPTPPSSRSSSRNSPSMRQAMSSPKYQLWSWNVSRRNSMAKARHTREQARNSSVQAGSARPPTTNVPGSRNVSMSSSTASSL